MAGSRVCLARLPRQNRPRLARRRKSAVTVALVAVKAAAKVVLVALRAVVLKAEARVAAKAVVVVAVVVVVKVVAAAVIARVRVSAARPIKRPRRLSRPLHRSSLPVPLKRRGLSRVRTVDHVASRVAVVSVVATVVNAVKAAQKAVRRVVAKAKVRVAATNVALNAPRVRTTAVAARRKKPHC